MNDAPAHVTYVCGRVCRQIYEDSIVLQSVFTSTRERLEKISAVSKAQPPPAPKPTVEESDDDSDTDDDSDDDDDDDG